jgi:hypothetical protein
MADRFEASFDERSDFFDERDGAGPLTPGALVDETAGAWCRLPSDRPGPCVPVDVGATDARYLADPGRGASGEDDDIAPAVEVIGRPGDQRADGATSPRVSATR